MKSLAKHTMETAAVVMSIALLAAGCGSTTDSSAANSSATSSTQEQTGTASVTGTESEIATSETTESIQEEVEAEQGNTDSFEEISVVDNEYCSITITELDEDNFWGYSLKATLENKSEDTTYMFTVQDSSINNVYSEPFWASEVAAGKKSNETISFVDSDLENYDIGDISDIAMTFNVYDSNDYEAEPVALETVHVYPLGEENATAYQRTDEEGDLVLVDNDQIKIVVIGSEEDGLLGYDVNMYIENKMDSATMFAVDEASVNGYMLDPFWAESVPAGQVSFATMTFYSADLEENGIENVENIEFVLRAYNDEDYSADDYFNEVCTLSFE